ncbi:uncharacterized protein BJ171DRAFT_424199, partial [Polychytrium aggregatum]|uniref:uncharacterized protein n=1 Tax=Polychytrium aggregatum TaxID=110093 RepID=UPI0022FE38E5
MELLNPDGQLRIGLTPSDEIALSLHCEDPVKTGRSWLEDQADQGNATASYLLARIIQVELDRVPDREWWATCQRIFFLLEQAAHAGHLMAECHLAECYYYGQGVKRDHTKAVGMYRHLADQGHPQAQIGLGLCYEDGKGVQQDFNVAFEWYSKAAN